jgi:hypothetical protein
VGKEAIREEDRVEISITLNVLIHFVITNKIKLESTEE